MLKTLVYDLENSKDCCNVLYSFLHSIKNNKDAFLQSILSTKELDISRLNDEYKSYIVATIEYLCNESNNPLPIYILPYTDIKCPIESLDLFTFYKDNYDEDIASNMVNNALKYALAEYKKHNIPRIAFNDAI